MKYEIQLKNVPAGYILEVVGEGRLVKLLQNGFITSEAGQIYFKYLEEFEKMYLGPFIKSGNKVSTIDHCLVLIDKNKKAKVFINELKFLSTILVKRDIVAGEPMYKSDIGGIVDLKFENISIPIDNGIALYFSFEWRNGFFFDYRPLMSDSTLENIYRSLGEVFQYLVFNEIYSMDEAQLKEIFALGWFPFIRIIGGLFEKLANGFSSNALIKPFEDEIIGYFNKDKIKKIMETWKKHDAFRNHIPFLECGIQQFLEEDYISCINNIWPRIEGILRLVYLGDDDSVSQKTLLDNMKEVVANKLISPSIFLPSEFKDYLSEYYFKHFDLKKGELDLSRHTIAHGVSDASEYDKKHALIGILIVDQISYYIGLMEYKELKK
jgi:hypothetical protein